MSKETWTIGPELRSGRFGGPTISDGGSTIAVVFSGGGQAGYRAKLIASAPALRDSLTELLAEPSEANRLAALAILERLK